jgi:hypothetical protein
VVADDDATRLKDQAALALALAPRAVQVHAWSGGQRF